MKKVSPKEKMKNSGKTKAFAASTHFVTITNCKTTRAQDDVVDRLVSFLPAYKSLVIACEKHGKGDLHYHLFWDGKKKWKFTKATWAPIREWLQASNDDYKRWGKNTGITKKEWLVEKWRYCNNLATAEFAESKGDAKGQVWVFNDGVAYDSAQAEEVSNLKPDAEILMKFVEGGEGLTEQYQGAEWTRKAYIAKNWDVLVKMISNHKRIQREIKNSTPRFTKDDFHVCSAAEEHDFSAKCMVLRGPSNVGKTQYAKTFFKKPLLVRHMDKLKQFDETVHDGIIFDDLSFGHWPRSSMIGLLDVEEEADINVKNSMVVIPAGTPRIFTTNQQLQVYEEDFGTQKHSKEKSFLPDKLDQSDIAMHRRLQVFTVGDLRKGVPLE